MIIILAVLSLVVVKALTDSPWGLFTIAATIPIALLMGIYMRFIRPGRVGEASIVRRRAAARLDSSSGRPSPHDPTWGPLFTLTGTQLAWALIIYGAIAVEPAGVADARAARLPEHLPQDRHRSWRWRIGIYFVAPPLAMPATTRFIDGTGPVFSGTLFPFLFITIACGAVSGFHALISSGTTPKMVERESHMRLIGFGGMLTESFVAVMALTAACVLDPGIYFAMNAPAAVIGTTAANAAQVIFELGLHDHAGHDQRRRRRTSARTRILSRAGGAPTLAVGMAQILGAGAAAASRWRRSGTTSPSCSRRCSS